MIARLTGKIVADDENGLVLDVSGVGYELHVPLGAAGRARTDAEGRATFYVHTHVREDALSLFGFASDSDRAAFRALLSVSNVGPRTAVAVMSALPAEELSRAVASKDLKALTAIPGIGKKTAEMMLLQLRDKLDAPMVHAAAKAQGQGAPGAGKPGRTGELVASALVGMGYRVSDAERAVTALGDKVHTGAMPELLREALALLSK